MADAAIPSGAEMEPEQHQRPEQSSAGPGGLSRRARGAEDSAQNGGRAQSAGAALPAAAAGDAGPANPSVPSSSQRRSSISAAHEQQQRLQPPSGVSGGPPPLPKPPEDLAVGRNFQIPRKSREKKGCSLSFPPSSPSLPSSSGSLGRLFMHLAQLHAEPCGCGGACGLLRLARLLGTRLGVPGRLLHSFLSLALLFSFSFCHKEKEKTKTKKQP